MKLMQIFAPAKTRGGTLESPGYIGNVVYSGKDSGKNFNFRELGPQRINETEALR